MTDEQIKEYLKEQGCSNVVCEGGREGLVRMWEQFVTEVEQGYCPKCLIQEYWNDLDTRDLIHDIGCDDDVGEFDTRFRAILTATHIKHWRTDRTSDYDFWNRGYPRNATGYFYEEIKRYILCRSEE